MKNHTSGTWEIDPDRPDYGRTAGPSNFLGYYVRCAENGGRIGQVFENCLVTTVEEARANAQLFAAGPDLLAAAKRGMAALAANGAPNCEAAKELRAAIAKAEHGVGAREADQALEQGHIG